MYFLVQVFFLVRFDQQIQLKLKNKMILVWKTQGKGAPFEIVFLDFISYVIQMLSMHTNCEDRNFQNAIIVLRRR